jgi:hypothetical protein
LIYFRISSFMLFKFRLFYLSGVPLRKKSKSLFITSKCCLPYLETKTQFHGQIVLGWECHLNYIMCTEKSKCLTCVCCLSFLSFWKANVLVRTVDVYRKHWCIQDMSRSENLKHKTNILYYVTILVSDICWNHRICNT